jgi:hypothetical protein
MSVKHGDGIRYYRGRIWNKEADEKKNVWNKQKGLKLGQHGGVLDIQRGM